MELCTGRALPLLLRRSVERVSLFSEIASAFRAKCLPFDPRNFGTAYRLVGNTRIDRYLTGAMPWISTTGLEQLRDACVGRIPPFAARLAQQDLANQTFIQRALAYSNAEVFVDACKSPYRLRHLRRLAGLQLQVVHLLRDPRGVALSNMTKRGWDAALSARLWIREQATILRIVREFPWVTQVYYEDVCDAADETVARLSRFVGLAPHSLPADFKTVEHHILGNWMRLRTSGAITRDTRWQTALSSRDRDAILQRLRAFLSRHETHPLSAIIRRYLEEK